MAFVWWYSTRFGSYQQHPRPDIERNYLLLVFATVVDRHVPRGGRDSFRVQRLATTSHLCLWLDHVWGCHGGGNGWCLDSHCGNLVVCTSQATKERMTLLGSVMSTESTFDGLHKKDGVTLSLSAVPRYTSGRPSVVLSTRIAHAFFVFRLTFTLASNLIISNLLAKRMHSRTVSMRQLAFKLCMINSQIRA